MNKKGFVWISAVLYIALGMVAISLVMTAGLPLINKMKDRNTIIQTKDVMHAIDTNIWQVRSEGVGSRRFLEPVIIKGGKLMIFDDGSSSNPNQIRWEMKTTAKVIETCTEGETYEETLKTCSQSEGNLKMIGYETKVEGEDLIVLVLDYDRSMKLEVGDYTSGSGLVGKYGISIENKGSEATGQREGMILITIR